MMTIKVNLKVLMAENDLNMVSLAKLTGLTRQTISRLANNETLMFDRDVLNKICIALKCVPGDILLFEEEKISA